LGAAAGYRERAAEVSAEAAGLADLDKRIIGIKICLSTTHG
jgi:hypothetical protein